VPRPLAIELQSCASDWFVLGLAPTPLAASDGDPVPLRPPDMLSRRTAREITDAAAGIHCGAEERGGVAARRARRSRDELPDPPEGCPGASRG
jgi:hypothetical protein